MIQIPKSYMYSNRGLDSLMRIHFCIFNYKSFFQIQKFDGVQCTINTLWSTYTKQKVGLCLQRSIDEFVELTSTQMQHFLYFVINYIKFSVKTAYNIFFQRRTKKIPMHKVLIAITCIT